MFGDNLHNLIRREAVNLNLTVIDQSFKSNPLERVNNLRCDKIYSMNLIRQDTHLI